MAFISGDPNLAGTGSPAPLSPAAPYTEIGGAVVTVDKVLKVGVGASGSFSTLTGQIVTVQNGIITNIY
jgi:hypothetical protein